MTPEKQKQFDEELKLVLAIAAQIYPVERDVQLAVTVAINLIKESELHLKAFYERPDVSQACESLESKVSPGTGLVAQGDSVGRGGGEPKSAVPAGTPKPTRKVINDSISECSRIILAKKLRTQDQLVKMVEAFAVKRKEELNEGQALKLLEQLKEILA